MICNKCNKDLSIDKFAIKGKGFQKTCKYCHKEYLKVHYNNNKEKYKDQAKKYREEFYNWFITIKSKLKCEECNESRYWTLDFHHINPEEKEETISKLLQSCNKDKIINEINKCKVLCANCHRDFHYKQKRHL